MKATAKLLATALAAAGLGMMAADVHAERGGRGGSTAHGGSHGGGHARGGHWGGHRHWGGYWGPRLGFYFGVPVAVGLGYWGYPYAWDYPRETVVYREMAPAPEGGQLVPQAPAEPASGSAPAPASGPLYMNYCESAREYYPKVSRCPEGWKFVTPTS